MHWFYPIHHQRRYEADSPLNFVAWATPTEHLDLLSSTQVCTNAKPPVRANEGGLVSAFDLNGSIALWITPNIGDDATSIKVQTILSTSLTQASVILAKRSNEFAKLGSTDSTKISVRLLSLKLQTKHQNLAKLEWNFELQRLTQKRN